jgi:hypothetical protein
MAFDMNFQPGDLLVNSMGEIILIAEITPDKIVGYWRGNLQSIGFTKNIEINTLNDLWKHIPIKV